MKPFPTLRLAAVAMTLPKLAQADCANGAELLFACTFQSGAKTVTTCLSDDLVSYAFGPTGGTPELQMTRHVRDVDMQPWNGFGRWLAEGFALRNGDYAYTLRYGIDRLSEELVIEGDLAVSRGDTILADLMCDAGSVRTAGFPLPLYDAKLDAGQIWDGEEFMWKE